jgi:hypothetical protein
MITFRQHFHGGEIRSRFKVGDILSYAQWRRLARRGCTIAECRCHGLIPETDKEGRSFALDFLQPFRPDFDGEDYVRIVPAEEW